MSGMGLWESMAMQEMKPRDMRECLSPDDAENERRHAFLAMHSQPKHAAARLEPGGIIEVQPGMVPYARFVECNRKLKAREYTNCDGCGAPVTDGVCSYCRRGDV